MDSIEYEALRRAQEMHRKAPVSNTRNTHQTSKGQQNSQSQRNSQQPSQPPSNQNSQPQPQKASQTKEAPSLQQSSNDLLPALFEDKEKLLILVLILILSGEESHDPALTLALLYLII